MNKTQIMVVESILRRKKKINNFTVLDSHISLRLADIIFKLRNRGWQIEGHFIGDTRNYEYKLVSAPE